MDANAVASLFEYAGLFMFILAIVCVAMIYRV